MGLKNFKFNKESFNPKKIKDFIWNISLNKFGIIFTSVFLIAAILGGFIIYKYTYNDEWSENQKREYRLQVEKNKTYFNLDGFNDTVRIINEKNSNSNQDIDVPRDFFGATDE